MSAREELATGGYSYMEVFAEGHHSGSTGTEGMFIPTSFLEEFSEEIASHTFYFHELDGKHSETEGDVSFSDITPENVDDFVKDWLVNDGYEKIYDMLVEIDPDLAKAADKYNVGLMKVAKRVVTLKIEWSDT
jgi:hypothetical protein